jgi:serine/threonine-protein kinase
MGEVWEAVNVLLGKRVAIKFMDPANAHDRSARVRFEIEARAATLVRSKHAIQIFDLGTGEDGLPYIVMELLDGETLESRLARRKRLSVAETATIVEQVCRALHVAHASGVVHRDLKPANIFLTRHPDERGEIAKVLDFGVAKLQHGELGGATMEGDVVGTPYFMSPEQLSGERGLEHFADLWAVAVIAYACATGRVPFDAPSMSELVAKIFEASPPPPSSIAPDLSPAFDAWVKRAFTRTKERRFASAGDLATELRRASSVWVAGEATARHEQGATFDDAPTVRRSLPSSPPPPWPSPSLPPPDHAVAVAEAPVSRARMAVAACVAVALCVAPATLVAGARHARAFVAARTHAAPFALVAAVPRAPAR